MHAGQTSGEAGVLSLLADGERQLVVWDDDGRVLGLGINDHATHVGRRKGVGDAGGGIVAPQHHVDALTLELGDHGTHTASLGADAGTHRVEPVVDGRDGHLGANTWVASDGADLDDVVVDLGDLKLKEPADEVGVSARQNDRGPLALPLDGHLPGVGIAHVDDDRADLLVVTVALACGALVSLVRMAVQVEVWQLRLDALANLYEGELRRRLEDAARDELTDAVLELVVDLPAAGVSDHLVDDALGMLGGKAARTCGSNVLLGEVGVLALVLTL